ncbi:MAG TPA: hypothetical protein VM141_10625, partial [Planctomycetota bacterium]|nr:hypothetical protein [Planctomycetota bacterium]
RIYFAVRDERWDTVMPEFSAMNVQKQENGFKITMNAVSRNDVADFTWSAEITGTPDGKITFKAGGQAGREFKSYRVGICVLYGAESLAGQAFETIDDKGAATAGQFSQNVSPKHLASNFRTLRYTTADGMEVTAGLAEGQFAMEDQRLFGDSSYKAFSGIPYKYPNVPKGEKGEQVLTLEVKNAKEQPTAGPVRITLGEAAAGAKLPKMAKPDSSKKPGGFMSFNDPKHAEADHVSFAYNPAAHMPDDDTFMENATAILDQVRSVRAYAAKAKFCIEPITINSPYPRPGADPRNEGLFAAAWCTRVMKYAALAGVDEAAFGVGAGTGYAARVLEDFVKNQGAKVLLTTIAPAAPPSVDAFAIEAKDSTVVWLINLTDQPQKAVVSLPNATRAELARLNEKTRTKFESLRAAVENGELAAELAAFEVCRITVKK